MTAIECRLQRLVPDAIGLVVDGASVALRGLSCASETDVRCPATAVLANCASKQPLVAVSQWFSIQSARHWGVAALRSEEAYVNTLDPQVMA